MTVTNVDLVTEEAYRRIALGDPDVHWELHRGRLREKAGMTFSHNWLWFRLGIELDEQVDPERFVVGVNGGRVRRTAANFYIPDVFVAPTEQTIPLRGRSHVLEVYEEPLPLVVEVWFPSTGDDDVTEKLAEYQARGDREIWLLHSYDRTLTAWRCQHDGSYQHTVYRGAAVRPAFLPDVAVDLDALVASTD